MAWRSTSIGIMISRIFLPNVASLLLVMIILAMAKVREAHTDLGVMPLHGGKEVLIADVHKVRLTVLQSCYDVLPYFIFGHSMGRFVNPLLFGEVFPAVLREPLFVVQETNLCHFVCFGVVLHALLVLLKGKSINLLSWKRLLLERSLYLSMTSVQRMLGFRQILRWFASYDADPFIRYHVFCGWFCNVD